MKWIAIASVALLVGARPAAADTITNTFVDTVLSADNSGVASDGSRYFGGGNLFGAPFTLTMTLDSTRYYTIDDPANPSFITGGTYYSGSSNDNSISAALTINGDIYTINDSSDAFYADLGNGTIEALVGALKWSDAFGGIQTQAFVSPLASKKLEPLSTKSLLLKSIVDSGVVRNGDAGTLVIRSRFTCPERGSREYSRA